MVEFLTLFLGLVSGPQEVAVVVGPEVAAVELRVDGDTRARLEGEPWRTEMDLGPGLLPRRLAAVALDAAGAEIGRAEQTLNRPRPQAEARILFERQGGRVRAARVTWESLAGRLPLRSRALLDGEPIAVVDPARIELPEVDSRRLHVFQVELQFAGDVTARAHAAFGGETVEDTATRLTALPLLLDKKKDPKVDAVRGWLADPGAARVVGVEKGPIMVSVVRGAGVLEAMERLEGRGGGATGPGVVISSATAAGTAGVGDISPAAGASQRETLRHALKLEGDHVLQVQLPFARSVRHDYLALELFGTSPEITPDEGGLYWALTRKILLPGASTEQRLADAVAIAGMRAASGNLRRALVLVLGDDLSDTSRHSAAEVRSFLEAADVPLYIWYLGEGRAPSQWGQAEEVATYQDLRRAVRSLDRDLERQRIVWVDGAHPAHELRLAKSAPARRLGGTERQ